MTLYHATNSENLNDILENGLIPITNVESRFNRDIKICGVYGFTELKDALGFARDNSLECVVTFNVEINDLYLDPEYSGDDGYGVAYFLETENNVEAFKVEL